MTKETYIKESIWLKACLHIQKFSPLSWQGTGQPVWCCSNSWELHPDLQAERERETGQRQTGSSMGFETSRTTLSDTISPPKPYLLILFLSKDSISSWLTTEIPEPMGRWGNHSWSKPYTWVINWLIAHDFWWHLPWTDGLIENLLFGGGHASER